jgi:uncharacterized protein (TIGR03437 family)
MRTGSLFLLLVLAPLLLSARDGSGTISGHVANPEGVVRIVATRLDTGEQFSSSANGAGEFTLASLPPGAYRVIVRNETGSAVAHRYVTVQAGAAVRLNARLEASWPPNRAGTRTSARLAASASAADLPPLIRQFEEGTRNLNAVALVDDNNGWAVGDPHWDQATRQVKGTIIKTTDGGVTWSNQDPGGTDALNGLFFLNASQGWVVGDNGAILHTTDGGAHWTRQPASTGYNFHSVAFTDGSNGWAAGDAPIQYYGFNEWRFTDWQAGIWHTTDGGQTWSPQTVPASAALLARIVFTGANTGFAAGSKQNGFDQNGDPALLGAIYGTTDGGRTWNEIQATFVEFTFTSLYFTDASNGWASGFPASSLYSGACTYQTADGGKTWKSQKLGAYDQRVRDIHMLDANRGYAVGASGIGFLWRTLDGGATWTEIGLPDANSTADVGYWGLAATANRVLIVGDRDFTAYSPHPWDACTSSNSSCSTLFTEAYISPQYVFHDVFFADRNNGWAAGTRSFSAQVWGQEIFRTADGGNTWQSQYEDAPASTGGPVSHWLDSICFTDPLRGWAVGTSRQGSDNKSHNSILHTADGGVTWKEQGTELYAGYPLEFTKVQFLDSQNGWALAKMKFPSDDVFLAHTTNGGALWSWVDTGIASYSPPGGMRFADSQHGCFSAWGIAACTSDGGAHWTRSAVACPYSSCIIDCNTIAFPDALHGWSAGTNQLYQTSDGGAHWSMNTPKSMSNDTFEAIQFPDSSHGWLSGEGGILFQTADAGATWQPVNAGTSVNLRGLSFPDAQHGWIVGDFGTILSYSGDRTPAGIPAVFSALNAASYSNQTSPNAWISLFGANLSATTRLWTGSDFINNRLPTKLDGVSVSVNGLPAYLSYISPAQINAMFPDDGSTGPVSVQVTNSQGSSGTLSVQKAAYSPALFRFSVENGVYAIAQTTDGKLVGNYLVGTDLGIFNQMRQANPGDVLTLYGTGFGPTSPALPSDTLVGAPAPLASPVTFSIGGMNAPVQWAGMIGSGLYQFNVQVPALALAGDLVIVAQIAGYRTQGDSVITVSLQ